MFLKLWSKDFWCPFEGTQSPFGEEFNKWILQDPPLPSPDKAAPSSPDCVLRGQVESKF